MIVYIVRHTSVQLDGNTTCYGNTDVDVRSTFEEEAAVTKRTLEGLSFDGVYSSPLQRAYKLACYCGYPDAILDDRLREMNFGDWEERDWVDILPTLEGSEGDFFDRFLTEPVPGGESLQDQYERVVDFLRERKKEGHQQILVFCHGGVINCARAATGLFDLKDAFAQLPNFGSVTTLDFSALEV